MLHQKLFFKDLLDHSSSKLELSETIETGMMPRLAKMINDDDQAGHILINALLKLNDQLNPSISGEIEAELTLTCLLYTSPSPRDLSTSRMPSSA